MNYLRIYVTIFTFSLLTASLVYRWLPNYRGHLFGEDGLVENLSALLFLSSCFLALRLFRKRRYRPKMLLLVSVVGLIGFLDEISFGERYFKLSMPHLANVKIDGVHDLFTLAYTQKAHTYPFTGIGIILIITLISLWLKFIVQFPSFLIKSPSFFLIILVVLIFVASIIDLETINYNPLYMLEEMLEMNAGLALIFYSLSLSGLPLSHKIK